MSDSSPHSTVAAQITASRRALAPGGPLFAASELSEVVGDEVQVFTVAYGADDQVGNGAGEVQIAVAVLGVCYALGACDDVGGVLAGGEVEGQQHVGVVRVGRSDGTGLQGADEVLADVERGDRCRAGVQVLFDEVAGNHDLGDHVFSTA